MQILKKLPVLHVLLVFLFTFPTSKSEETNSSMSYCDKTTIQKEFFSQSSMQLFPLNRMLICKTQKLYYKTTLGLFQVSSVDYKSKLFTVSHSFWSSTSHFISPKVLSAGFPHPPQPNSLALFNCSIPKTRSSPFLSNCSSLEGYRGSSKLPQQVFAKGISPCLVIEDVQKLDVDFHPKEMNCTHYSRMYKRAASLDENSSNYEFKLGTRISFDIPDHVPNPCDKCKKPNGNCGVGLRCFCHPIQCRIKVISIGVKLNPFGGMLFSFICFIIVMDFFTSS